MAIPRWVVTPSDIEEIFDGEQWREVITVNLPATVGALSFTGYETIQMPFLAAELAGQAQATWVTAWPLATLPCFRFDPSSASAQIIIPGAGTGG